MEKDKITKNKTIHEYRSEFKKKCSECIWKMVNDGSVKHDNFYIKAENVTTLWNSFSKKLKTASSLLNHVDLYNEYIIRLQNIYKK